MSSRKPGRPIVLREPYSKITVVLLQRQVAFLDDVSVGVRVRHGKAVSRAELLRGLVEAASRLGVDLTQASSADELAALVARAFRKRP